MGGKRARKLREKEREMGWKSEVKKQGDSLTRRGSEAKAKLRVWMDGDWRERAASEQEPRSE